MEELKIRTGENGKVYYNGIDFFKLICAFLIVFLHTYCYDWGNLGFVINNGITNIGVPFFFIVSGFFFGNGLIKQNSEKERKKYFWNYEKKLIIMYAIWSVVTLPISIYNLYMAKGKMSIVMYILYIVRGFFFSGSLGIYWYILALIYGALIIFVFKKFNKEKVLYIISLAFFIYGLLYNGEIINPDSILYKLIDIPFGSERNFLTVGLLYMNIGVIFSNNVKKITRLYSNNNHSISVTWVLLLVFTALKILEIFFLPIHFLQAFQAIALFLIAMNTKFSFLDGKTQNIRKASTALYMLQFPFILLFDYYLKRGTLIDFPLTCAFCLVVWLILSKILPKKVNRMLFG